MQFPLTQMGTPDPPGPQMLGLQDTIPGLFSFKKLCEFMFVCVSMGRARMRARAHVCLETRKRPWVP